MTILYRLLLYFQQFTLLLRTILVFPLRIVLSFLVNRIWVGCVLYGAGSTLIRHHSRVDNWRGTSPGITTPHLSMHCPELGTYLGRYLCRTARLISILRDTTFPGRLQ
jgi:hypothetical protein